MSKNNDLYRILFHQAKDGVFVVNSEGQIVDANQSLLDLLGYSHKEIKKLNVNDLLVDAAATTRLVETLQEVGTVQDYPLRVRRQDGTMFEAINTISVQQDEDGRIQNFLGIIRDVTAHKQADEAMHQRQEILEALNVLTQDIAAELEPVAILQTAVQRIGEIFRATSAYIGVFDIAAGIERVVAEYYGPDATAAERVSDLGVEYALADVGIDPENLDIKTYEVIYADDADLPAFETGQMTTFGGNTVLDVLLVARGRLVGLLEIWDSRTRREFTEMELELAQAIGRQIALAVDNAQYVAQIKQQVAERQQAEAALRQSEENGRRFQEKLQILQEANLELSRLDDLDEIYQRAIQLGHERLGFERLGLLLYDEHTGSLRGTFGIDESGIIKDERTLQQEPGDTFMEIFQTDKRAVLWEDVPLYSNGLQTGHGWNAIAALWDGNQGIGWLATDNFMSGEPPAVYMLDILTLYGDNIGHLITRKRNEQAAREFQEKLQALQEVNLELSRLDSTAEMYRQAIVLGRERLGIDRMGLLLYDAASNTMSGTFGTDNHGEIRDERYFQQVVDDPDVLDVLQKKQRLGFWEGKPLRDEGRIIGKGWNAMATMWYEDAVLGWLAADNLLNREPLLSYQPDLLALYADTLAHLLVRLRAEEKLRESQQRLAILVQQSPLAVIEWDMAFQVKEWNLAAERIFGYSREEVIGQHARLIIPPEYHIHVDAVWQGLLAQTGGNTSKNGNVTKDGRLIICEWSNTQLVDEKGAVIGVASLVQDITDREALQAQVQESLDRRGREVALSTQIAQEIASAADLNDLYQRVVTQIQEQFGYYHTQLLRYDPAMQTLALTVGYGEVGEKMLALHHSVPMGVGLIGKAAASGKSILRPNLAGDTEHRPNPLLPATRGELAVPIKLKDEVLGVLDVQSDTADALNENDQLVLEGLCGQIAVAIESTILRQEMEARLRELNALQRQMTREGWHDYQVGRQRSSGYHFTHAGVQPVELVVEKQNGRQQNGQNGDTAVSALAISHTPLQIRNETIGFLGIQSDPDNPLSPEEQEFLDAVSKEVAEALEAARLFEQTQDSLSEQERLTAELETVAQVSTAASTILEADALLQAVVDLSKSSFNLYHVHIYLLNETGRKLILKAGAGNVGRLMALEGREINIEADSLISRAARTRQGVMENNVRKTIDFLPHPLLPNTQAEIAVPMIVGDKLIGILDLQSDQADSFTEDDLKIHRTLASQIAIALENARQYAEQVETSAKLRELDRLKSEFLASMSHELRTPLNSIIGFADVLLEGLDGELNERMEEDVRLIRDGGRHLRELIGEILDMSKIEAGRMELRYEEIDLRQMAQDIMATAAPLAQEKNLDMYLDLDEAITTIEADRTRLRQILWNIMGNAIKFTEKGSVSLSMRRKADHVLIAIRDTGIGIKEENIPIVFEPFRQIDGGLNRAVGGTGLGMPITKKLVEIHGGEIWIESVYGQGSTFFFTLPYLPALSKPVTGPLPIIA